MAEPDLKNMSYRMRYYYAHKDEPEFVERLRASRRKWYYENLEVEREKSRERFRKRKALEDEEKEMLRQAQLSLAELKD